MRAFLDDLISSFNTNPRIVEQRQLAKRNRWLFAARRKLETEPEGLKQFRLFQGTRGKRLMAVMVMRSFKLKGVFRVYDYRYFSDFGTRTTTVFEYQNPRLKLSSFSISPKPALSSFKELFVVPELLFATTPDFNKSYQINAANAKATKKDLNEDFLDLIGDEAGWTFEGKGNYLIAYQLHKRVETADIEANLSRFGYICDRLMFGESHT